MLLVVINQLKSDSFQKILMFFIIGNVIIFLFYIIPTKPMINKSSGWDQIKAIIASKHNIYNNPAIAPILLDENKTIYDSGQTEYGAFAEVESRLFHVFFIDNNARIRAQSVKFKEDILNQIKTCRYDLVVITSDQFDMVDRKFLSSLYSLKEHVIVTMPYAQQSWNLEVWYPKCNVKINEHKLLVD